MHDNRQLIEKRVQRVLTERIRPAVHRTVATLDVMAWQPDGGQGEPVPPATALAADYAPFAVGTSWGPAWGTSWFHLTGQVPADAAGLPVEVVLDLGWTPATPGFQAEGLVYLPDGSAVKGVHPRNTWIPVAEHADSEQIDVFVEAAANPMIFETAGSFLPTARGEKSTAGDGPLYRLDRADICVVEREVWELVADIEVLDGLMRSLGEHEGRRFDILYALDRALDRIELADVAGTASGARAELTEVLAAPASAGAHRISAVGHAHIDSAWLWPVRETIRKVARTCSNVVQLLDTNDDLVYAMSSAQQYEWIEQQRPEVFARVAEHVKGGRFVPVGGMWVESDTNMVGGEAMARQFLLGKGYFLEHFGVDCNEVWLPDSFGYSAALPQIVRLAGIDHFLTQKISWNQQNKFPHHTFNWEGIDGTRVFTHFPPIDTYNSDLSGGELAHAAENFQEKGAAHRSLAPFGWGDGGGGPTREMVGRARRTADLAGSPRVTLESPQAFFAAAEAEYPDAPVWVGELYLELHRGTYTSQAKTKQGNRRSEHLLREAELWASTATIRGVADYPYEQLQRIWKLVLLQQFHDILPGSSITWVHREAAANYAAVAEELTDLIAGTQAVLAGDGTDPITFNAAPFQRSGVAALGAGAQATDDAAVTVTNNNGNVLLDNGLLRVTIDDRGLVTSVVDLDADREVVPAGTAANLLQLHPDLPNQWDAWDVDSFYRNTVRDLVTHNGIEVQQPTAAESAATVRLRRSFGASMVLQEMVLRPGSRQLDCSVDVDWHERETILKAAFPIDVHTDRAAFETQFGHLYRDTHLNTSWDAARFEVCAHRFVQVAENGYGAAVVNDSTYGHDVTRQASSGGASYSVVRLSLLRAPQFPDPETDQGQHLLHYALVPGADVQAAAAAGYAINLPTRTVTGTGRIDPVVTVGDGAVVEAVKLAEDRSGDVVVRLYEPAGKRATVTVTPSFGATSVTEVDLLERPLGSGANTKPMRAALQDGDSATATLKLMPFQIVTLRWHR